MAESTQGGAPPAALQLTCRPGKAGNILTFPYTVQNTGPADIYAMHALPTVDRQSGEPAANDQAAVVILGDNGEAIVGKFAAPLPTARRIAVPVLHLARHLPAGASLEARLEIALPLAETSPYFADLTLRQYEVVDIKAVAFTLGYWVAGVDGLVAAPADYAPELFVVVTRNTLRSALRVSQRFPTTGLQVFKRTDEFPRLTALA
jgi:hypothetical protein